MLSSLVLVTLAANPYLDEGRRHFANLEFDAAAKALAIATEQPGLSTPERREAFDVYAQALLALQRRDEAISAYRRLLESDAYAPPPQAAPKVVECFLAAKRLAYPPPGVKVASTVDGKTVAVTVFDPWGDVKRVRWFEGTAAELREGAAVELREHQVRLTPSKTAQRVLFDALGNADVLLAHGELELGGASSTTPSRAVTQPSPGPRWLTLGAGGGAVVAAGLSAVLLGLAFRAAPAISDAPGVNTWNAQRQSEAAVGWTLGALALGAGVVALLSFLDVFSG